MRVRIGNVIRGQDLKPAGNGVDPARRSLDFTEDANWGFIDDHVSVAVRESGAELFIAEAGLELGGLKNRFQGRAFGYLGFNLQAPFLAPHPRFSLQGHLPNPSL